MTQDKETLREAVARAIWEAGANASTTKWENASHDAKLIVYQKADAALSLIQPEIDRRVAEEKAKLLDRLRTPSDAVLEAGMDYDERTLQIRLGRPPTVEECQLGEWQAMLDAFQQENSDER